MSGPEARRDIANGRPPIVALVGPTASGKSALALALAGRLSEHVGAPGVEIVSADSRQIYRLMDIATAKPTVDERAHVPHHLLDVVWPSEAYSLAQYQRDAQRAIAAIHERGRVPLVVGGTGLYVRAIVDGLAIPEVAPQAALRSALEAEAAASGASVLVERLERLDPVTAAAIDPRNIRRLIRAIEVCEVTGKPFSAQRGSRPTPYATVATLGLTADRQTLYTRADLRNAAMFEAGLVNETRMLAERGYDWSLPSMSSLGYREVGAYLRGEMTLNEAASRLDFATHAYIRRQLTWFRADRRIHWLNAGFPFDDLVNIALAATSAALTGHDH